MLIKFMVKCSDFGFQYWLEELELIIVLFGVWMKLVMYYSVFGGCCDCGDFVVWKELGYV